MDDSCGPYNDYDEIAFSTNPLTQEIVSSQIEQNLDRLNFKSNFIAWQKLYGNTVLVDTSDEKITIEADTGLYYTQHLIDGIA